MPIRSVLTLTAALLCAGCNTPSPTPEVATPDTGTVDTVAAAGAPLADSTDVIVDSTANAIVDSTVTEATDSSADSVAN
jgi:hypothetical protein